MKNKPTRDAIAAALKTREDIAELLAAVLKTGDLAAFATASATAQMALQNMATRRAPPADRDWFLKDWMALRNMSQVRLGQLTGWSAGKVSEVYNSQTQYRRDTVNQLAYALQIEPYELLMHPTCSHWIRQMLEVARIHLEEYGRP